FSRASYLAYAIAMRYRARGAVTVLGGPHARSFGAHAAPYFDYLCLLTDKETVRTILVSPERHDRAVVLSAAAQPKQLPTVEQRVRFIDHNIAKNAARKYLRTVPMIGSVGLDDDAGDEPFDLTKKFVDLAPGAFPGYSILTDFKNAPLSDELA